MYELAERVDPDDMWAIARLAYAELAMSGVTAVGEFHYLHHQPGGQPYTNRTEMAEACIRAALDVGIRICLIRTAYLRAGFQQTLDPAQMRFVDAEVETALLDIDRLQTEYADHPLVTVGVAAHSVRAVPLAEIQALAAYATARQLPFHMHVCEQRQELHESVAEYGVTPVRLLAENNLLNERFVGVHATHLTPDEIEALGEARAMVCLCRTTEQDLGDGLPQTADLVNAGVQLCVGVDSHAEGNAFVELRAVEWDERSRLEARHTVADGAALLAMGTRAGYAACGMAHAWSDDQVLLHRDDPALVGLDSDNVVDGVLFGAHPRCVDAVMVAGKRIVENGRLPHLPQIINEYQKTLHKLGWLPAIK